MDDIEKIAIFIPAYNVAHVLPSVIDRIPQVIKERAAEIYVIDNNSGDDTYSVAVNYKKQTGLSNLKILRNDRNMGYGGNQKVAYQYAIDRGFDIVVMLHGDAQYPPEKIPELVEAIKKDDSDMVFGSRMMGSPLKGGMPLYKFFGNKILTFVENFVLKSNLSEYHSGFRIYRCSALKQIPFNQCSDAYVFDTEILIQFKIRGLRITERPIPTRYNKDSRSPSLMDLFKYSANILRSLWMYVLHTKGIKKVKKFQIDPAT